MWWKRRRNGEVDPETSNYEDISDAEAERYIKVHGRKFEKDNLAYNSKHKAFIDALEKFGIDFDGNFEKEDMDNLKKKGNLKSIITCPRNDFYQMVKGKGCSTTLLIYSFLDFVLLLKI